MPKDTGLLRIFNNLLVKMIENTWIMPILQCLTHGVSNQQSKNKENIG